MANNSRRFLRLITERFNNSPFLNNASTAIGSASEKAHEKLTNIQNVASEKYENIVKVFCILYVDVFSIFNYF